MRMAFGCTYILGLLWRLHGHDDFRRSVHAHRSMELDEELDKLLTKACYPCNA